MRILITGAFGFAGRHLIRELLRADHDVVAFDLAAPPHEFRNIRSYTGDIQDPAGIERAVTESQPDACIHLSAITFVPDAWLDIKNVFSVNLIGTLNVLETFRRNAAKARILAISSAEVYGHNPRNHLLSENEALAPDNPYAISKSAADRTTLLYARQHGMQTIAARPGNHIGPGQSPEFVAPALARQISSIAKGEAPRVVNVGNLESKRDFTDVRDVARAYRLLVEHGHAGQAYNIASGTTITIRRLLEEFCAIAKVSPEIRTDPDRFRPAEERPILDIAEIGNDVGWKPEIPLAETLRDIMAECEKSAGLGSDSK